ncbi:MAG: hypothetical protein QOI12_2207 [Alphaproteobacteria bacterium]|jgi:hypothetical protein|nr:hypothetical protein [Alphaproteobacteria bacterium]
MRALSRRWLRVAFAVSFAAALHFCGGAAVAGVDHDLDRVSAVQSTDAAEVTRTPDEAAQILAAARLKADGQYCYSATECASRICRLNICGGPRKANGAQCYSAFECASQVCILNICGGPRKANGSQCFSALECASQRCLNRVCR